jgi:hypothetical protein
LELLNSNMAQAHMQTFHHAYITVTLHCGVFRNKWIIPTASEKIISTVLIC